MGQTLSNGVYLPNEGERNCYAGLASNWQILNTAVGNIAEKAPLVHTHGNISSDGKVGTTANLPLITGTGGAVQAGAFGNQANTFCEGNDSRLSDARTPVAHTHTKSDVTDLFNSANTWGGDNIYTYALTLKQTNIEEGVLPTSTQTKRFRIADKNNANLGWLQHRVSASGDSYLEFYVVNKFSNGQLSAQGSEIANVLNLGLHSDGSRYFTVAGDVYPDLPNRVCNLGTSTNRWATLNGLNPGALSLPDMDSTVSKSTELATAIDKTQTANSWTADFTGILRITWFVKYLTGPFRCSVSNNSDVRYATWGQTFSANDVWYFIVSFPVQNGKTYYFNNSFTRTSEDTSPIVYGASAVYCLGNV